MQCATRYVTGEGTSMGLLNLHILYGVVSLPPCGMGFEEVYTAQQRPALTRFVTSGLYGLTIGHNT